MTQTPTDHGQADRPDQDGEIGVDRDHLRDYSTLRRSRSDRRIAGVCGGLGRHLNIDPTVLRVVFVVLALFGGAGLLVYLAAVLIVPDDDSEHAVIAMSPSSRNVALIVVGAVGALILLGHSWGGFFWLPWPLLIVGLAVLAVVLATNGSRRGRSAVVAASSPSAPGASATTEPGLGEVGDPTAAWATVPPPQAPWSTPVPPPALPRRRGPLLFGVALGLIALACGGLGLYDVSAGHDVAIALYPAVALAIIGVLLVVGAFVARPGGLIALGLAATLALGVTSVISIGDVARVQTVTYLPGSAALVRFGYVNPVGQTTLDLTQVADPASLDGRTIDIHGRVGEIDVLLPPGVAADVTAHLGAGDVELGAHDDNGTGLDVRRTVGSGPTTIQLNVRLLAGHIIVETAKP